MRPSGVRASISGGQRRAIPFNSGVVLDGRASADLDVTGRPLSLAWKCRMVTSGLFTESDVLEGLQTMQSLPRVFETGSDCPTAVDQPPLNLTETRYLPMVDVPLFLRGDLQNDPRRRGPVLQLPSGSLPAGSIAVLSL